MSEKYRNQDLQTDITRLDREIDVWMYSLTEEEIRIVEGGEG